MTDDDDRSAGSDDDLPSGAEFWRWAGKAVRPYTGWLVMALGAVFLLVGYLGVSREAEVAKQLPYLISGGLGGIALVALGAFFLGTQDLRRELSRLDRIERLVGDLHGALLEEAPPAAPDDVPGPNGRSSSKRSSRSTSRA